MQHLLHALLCALSLLSPASAQGVEERDAFEDVEPRAPGVFQTSTANPPTLTTTKSGGALAPGYIFFQPGNPLRGGYIMTEDSELILDTHPGTNLDVGTLHGKPVLLYHYAQQGGHGFAYGPTVIKDNTYKLIHKVCPRLGLFVPFSKMGQTPQCEGDLHESQLDDGGTLAVTAYNTTQTDLTSLGGPANGWVYEGQFHIIDVETSETLFSWKSLDHVPVNQSHRHANKKADGSAPKKGVDYFHINAVEQLPDGRFLVSSRNTWKVFLIGQDGQIQYTLDGHTGGDFGSLPKEGKFSFQHDARLVSMSADGNDMVITIFGNNGGNAPAFKRSAGLRYHLDLANKKATLLKALVDPNNLVKSFAEGSVQLLNNGNTFVSYGTQPVFNEFGPDGNSDVRMTIQYGKPGQRQYRVYKKKWHATPHYAPAVAVQGGQGFVSWNGATNITGYAVSGGSDKTSLQQAATVPKNGFETSFAIPDGATFIQVAALRGNRQVRSSSIIPV